MIQVRKIEYLPGVIEYYGKRILKSGFKYSTAFKK
jgi:hypothetical protein